MIKSKTRYLKVNEEIASDNERKYKKALEEIMRRIVDVTGQNHVFNKSWRIANKALRASL